MSEKGATSTSIIEKPLISLISSPTITAIKLQGSSNYVSWATSMELWFMGQGYNNIVQQFGHGLKHPKLLVKVRLIIQYFIDVILMQMYLFDSLF